VKRDQPAEGHAEHAGIIRGSSDATLVGGQHQGVSDPLVLHRRKAGACGVEDGMATPVYFRNDYVGVEHATVPGLFGDVPVKPQLQKDLDAFASLWFRNLREQGFFERASEFVAQKQDHEPGR
jgi:hypothetical protein